MASLPGCETQVDWIDYGLFTMRKTMHLEPFRLPSSRAVGDSLGKGTVMLSSLRICLILGLLSSTLPAAVAHPVATKSAPAHLAQKSVVAPAAAPDPMPATFAGWQREAAPVLSADPMTADAANTPVLKEYGFTQLATAVYTNGDNKLNVRELRFVDATGAYGAFTFYRMPGTSPEDIGREGDANGTHILFWTGATLVEATFDHLTAMSAAALRELAAGIPPAPGAKNIPPSLPGYLPTKNREVTYTRYAIGPEGYSRSGGLLPPSLIDFNRGAEVLTGTFNEHNGTGQLTLIEYPTPQIAIDRERAISAYLKAGPPKPGSTQAAWPVILNESNTQALITRRSGPLIAMTSGALDDKDAVALLQQIHYEASVTWSKPEEQSSEPNKAARLLVGVITLFMILGAVTILLGVFFGGGRAFLRKLQGKPASTLHEAEFIKLDLK